MRCLLLCVLAAASAALVLGAPTIQQGALCPSLPVELELRTSPTIKNKYQLVFAAIDHEHAYEQADFVDIHYRINNEDSVNLRVQSHDALTDQNVPAKQAQLDGITLRPGDALRAYATYATKGYACDTPIHTFNAPEMPREREMLTNRIQTPRRRITRRDIGDEEEQYMTQARYMTQAAAERAGVIGTESSLCPSIHLDQDIVKIAGLDNTFMLTFENKNPLKQLHYVDLHLSTDAAKGWDNLRLASDMQLNLAHKVMQPGVVVKPYETLKWYWSYRTATNDGQVIDCTTPISQIAPQQVTHEITLKELNKAAQAN